MGAFLRATLVGIFGIRLVYLLIAYELGFGGVHRYHVDSAACMFLIVGALARLSLGSATRQPSPETRISPWMMFAFMGGAVLLYWPALSVGYLSDDWDLQSLARHWQIGPASADVFRPAVMLIWAVLQSIGASSAVAHGVNIAIHGTNAYLTTKLCAKWLSPGVPAVLAGAYFLTSPLAVEPVVWCSGLFDVAATAALLWLVLQSRRYAAPSAWRRAGFFGTAALAIACKETAVVGVVLVLIDVWLVRPPDRTRILRDAAVLLLVSVAYSGLRVANTPNRGLFSYTRNVLRRSLFETFGGLSAPWHGDVVARVPWLSIVGPTVLLIGLTVFFLSRRPSWTFAAGIAAWVMTSVAPVFRIVFATSDLQGSRYLYLGSCAWAALVVGLPLAVPRSIARWVLVAAVLALLAVNGWSVRTEIDHWREAAALRDRVIMALRTDPAFDRCSALTLTDLPDNVRGAFIFRIGAPEAVRMEAGKELVAQSLPECTLKWNPATERFAREGLH